MSSFLTQCPHCLTSFRVTDTQLEAADGLVRCGACLGIFSAAANRITLKQTPEEAAAAAPVPVEPEAEEDVDAADLADSREEFAAEHDDDEAEFEPEQRTEAVADAYEFVVPESFVAEPEPIIRVPPESEPAPFHDAESEPDLLDTEDFDIPLGDLNLDDGDSVEHAAETEEDAFEESTYDDEDFDEETEESEEDEYDEPEDEDVDELEEEQDEPPSAVIPRTPVTRITADKTELRRYLAEIEDDDALEPLDDDALDDFEEEPVLLDTAPRRSWLVTTALLLANVLLVIVLALQYADANIATLSRSASFATLQPYVCRIVECPPPERSQLDALVSEQLLVRSHPRYAQALEVNLVFRNDAAAAQPFPAIELGFHDTGNRLLANRLFQPGEYLPAELRTSDMPARSSLQVTLEMVDPGSEAVNYTLVFRKP